jgi:4-hydroxybenzoate polyprenyltransferase
MIRRFLTFVRFSHTIFALPFALGSTFVAAHGLPSFRAFLLIILAMVFARTAAMTFNRLTDWEIDKRNPRTAARHELVPYTVAVAACVIFAILFIVTTWFINPICFALSPIALIIVFFYSLTKCFTHAAQFFLGLALAAAPVGAWLAITGHFAWPPIVLGGSVLCWVAGFDIIYASQDLEIDKREGLHSMVVWLGLSRALALAGLLHVGALVGFLLFGVLAQLGPIYFIGLSFVAVGLVYEQILAGKGTIVSINRAFFHVNATVSTIFVVTTLADRLLQQ